MSAYKGVWKFIALTMWVTATNVLASLELVMGSGASHAYENDSFIESTHNNIHLKL